MNLSVLRVRTFSINSKPPKIFVGHSWGSKVLHDGKIIYDTGGVHFRALNLSFRLMRRND